MERAGSRGPFVTTRRDGPVLEVRLNRPDRLNAVSEELYADLLAALDQAADATIRAVLLAGEGRAFCAGADLKAHAVRERTADQRRAYISAGQDVCRRIQTLDQPVIAAVHGHAIGAGAEIALSADLLLCAADAQLRLPEVSLGTFVGGGITYRLPELVGAARARQLIMLGKPLSGQQAYDWGLAVEASPADQLAARATRLAHEVAVLPHVSMRLAKRALGSDGVTTLEDALAFEADALATCMTTAEWAEGVGRFAANQEPT